MQVPALAQCSWKSTINYSGVMRRALGSFHVYFHLHAQRVVESVMCFSGWKKQGCTENFVALSFAEDWSAQPATEDWSAAPTAQATEWVGTATEWS